MKELWSEFPNLIVVGECWQENSEGVVEISGVIPRSHALVKNITEDILTLTEGGKTNFDNFKFNDEFLKDYCKGAILMQSSFCHSSQSPLKSFHNSYLTIIDTLFFHEVVPITMHQEIDGIDSEIELYIQYFNQDFREMHASFQHSHKKKSDILSFSTVGDDEYLEKRFVEERREIFSKKIVARFMKARELRKNKLCLREGVNVPLKCVNQFGDIKTVLAYARHTEEQIGIIISNFEDNEKDVWIDFSPLKILMRKQSKNETTLVRIEYWSKESENEHHLINEFLFYPRKFTISAHDTLAFEVDVELDSDSHHELYTQAREKFMKNLDLIRQCNHMETANIYSKYIQHLVECYHIHRNIFFELNTPDEDLKDFHNFISKDQSVLEIIKKIVNRNSMGPIVFLTPELAPWFKIGGLAVMVAELARGFANLGEDTYVIVPYYSHKKNSGDKIILDPDGKYGIKYQFNIEVKLGDIFEIFGIHY